MSKPSWCLLAAFVIIFQQIAPIVSQTADKLGKCPFAPAIPECPRVPIKLCSVDGECPLNQKCCDDGCFGLKCQEPRDPTGSGSGPISTASSFMVGKSITSSGQRSTLPPKVGKCPFAPAIPECPLPIKLCSFDGECPLNQKCCYDGCFGLKCQEPRDLTRSGSGPISTASSLMVGNSAMSARSTLPPKVGKCPFAPAIPECPQVPIKLCSFDGECPLNQKCCDDGCVGLKCQELRDPTGSGSSPISTAPSLMVGNSAMSSEQRSTLPPKVGKCPFQPLVPECPLPIGLMCSFDGECPLNQKCCDDGCSGLKCKEPRDPTGRGSGSISTAPSLVVGNSAMSSGQRSTLPPIVGKCPFAPAIPECPLPIIKLCSFDGECPLNQKCCDDGCSGLKCQDPEPEVLSLESNILSGDASDYGRVLQMWIGGKSTWKLCWRATRDGWPAKIFHSNCDYKERTVTLVKVGQYIFGGYATASWEGFRRWKKAGGSFIFSLRNKENLPPFTAPLKDENTWHAIYADHRYGPIFGYGHDLYIASNALSSTTSHSSTNFNTTYQPRSGISGKVIKILAGSFRFSPSEIEVFHLV